MAALADANRLPTNAVPVVPGTISIQVLDAQGQIVKASPDADRLVPLLPPAVAAGQCPGAAGRVPGRPAVRPARRSGWLPWPSGTAARSSPRSPTSRSRASLASLTRALLIGTPLLLILLAGTSWLIVGSTLRPIAELRRGAEEVTRTGRPRDLPVPAARDEVRSLAVTLNDMLGQLGAAQERQRGLVSDTAHELRSPIASIRAQLEVALDHPDGQDWEQTAADVLTDTLRLARLAEDLLVLARLDERDRPRPPRRDVDLAGLAAEEVGRYADARVPVQLTAGRAGAVTGDPDGLRRMLSNLIDNAVRYAQSRVTVSLAADGTCVRLTVADDGPGIALADRERAFGRFTRLDEDRSRDDDSAGGAGLGLAIVRAIAQAHGGSARLEDAGPGLRAVVLLPAATRSPTAAAR